MAEPSSPRVRLITRYANRKLYDTGSGKLTSLGRIEELVRRGVEIRVVDHDTGEDMTGEVLVGILAHSVGERPGEGDVPLLTALIRNRGDLSATIDALLSQMGSEPAPPSPPAERKRPAAKRTSAAPR